MWKLKRSSRPPVHGPKGHGNSPGGGGNSPGGGDSPGGGGLSLPLLAWEGGSSYYAQFSKANAAGWDDPTFFPIGVWLSPPNNNKPALLAAAGVNVYIACEHTLPLTGVTSEGIAVMPQMDEWTTGEVGSNALAIAWFTTDEPDMNESFGDENGRLAAVEALVATANARADGRFTYCNIGNGVNKTFWSPNTVDDIVRAVDVAGVDQYAYTAEVVRDNMEASPDWPAGVDAQCAAAYGWLADQMRSFQGTTRKPFYVTVETAKPLLGEDPPDGISISLAQIQGAMWAAICHEARGIMFFQHNNDPAIEFYSLADEASINSAVAGYVAKVQALATVLNTQTSIWNYGASGIYTMTKVVGADLYIFACLALGGTVSGTKTFTLPDGVTGTTVTVLNEARTRTVTAGAFTDTFAAEYTHHIYQVSI